MSTYPGEEPRRDPSYDDAAQDVEHTQPYGYRPPGQQPSYGQPQQPYGQPYAAPAPGYGGYGAGSPVGATAPAPVLGQATTSMVLGIVGLASLTFCGIGLVVSPVAWVLGSSALRTIRGSGGRIGGEGQARAGRIMGIIGTVLLVLAVIAVVLFFVLTINASTSSGYEYGDV